MGDGWITFFDPPSLLIVLGGTFSALMVTFSMDEFKTAITGVKRFFKYVEPELHGYVNEFAELSRTARREGLLALDRRLRDCEDAFMKFGLEMAVDGIEEDEIEQLMKGRIANEAQKLQLVNKFFTNAGMFCPAFGMVGTLIGLIQMMQNLTDPSAIGAGMATAMITTFYGALLSNLVFLPAAVKAKTQMGMDLRAREIVLTGVLSIVRGESPTMIEKRLKLFLGEETEEEPPAAAPAPMAKAA